jgi:hypothetical protein
MKSKRFGPALRKRLFVGVLIVMALVFLLSAMRYLRPEAKDDLPVLGLMTTLPLQWSEGGVEAAVSSDAAPHPVYARLSVVYQVVPVDNLDQLAGLKLLFLAQPRGLSPGELVKLDAWVRGGGRLLLLADPALQWGSLYPFGDKRRPLFTSMLSPLFAYWGVELVLPIDKAEPTALRRLDGMTIRTQTPGEWRAKPGAKNMFCKIAADMIYAECAVGKGRAVLVADADLLDTPNWEGQGARLLTGSDEFGNMLFIEESLAGLQDDVER